MYRLISSMLFLLPAETAHYFSMNMLRLALRIPILSHTLRTLWQFDHPLLETKFLGLHLKNPIGVAAGFDKNGEYIAELASMGFGFIEVGTVTPLAQEGNSKPRLFRLKKDRAIINRMGFNNHGVDALVSRLQQIKRGEIIIGGNIGKNKQTPNERAHEDYIICLEKLYDHVDYFVINLSSPNTPGLRELQEKEPLKKLLTLLIHYRNQQSVRRPLLLKIAPDLSSSQLIDVIEIASELQLDGLIATNTTLSREGLRTDATQVHQIGMGGLSGDPLFELSTQILQQISLLNRAGLGIIGVGGISSAEQALEKMKAGAELIQVYSGFIYEGPMLIKRIKKTLINTNPRIRTSH